MMPIQGTLSESDYVSAQFLHVKPRPALKITGLLLVAICIAVAIFHPTLWFIVALAYLVGSFLIYMPFKARRTFRQYKALSEHVTIEVRDDGLFFKRTNGEGLVPWSHILKWRANDKMLLLYPASSMFYLITTKFFPSQDSFIEFKTLIETKLGKADHYRD